LYVIRTAVSAYEVFVTPECGSIVCNSQPGHHHVDHLLDKKQISRQNLSIQVQ